MPGIIAPIGFPRPCHYGQDAEAHWRSAVARNQQGTLHILSRSPHAGLLMGERPTHSGCHAEQDNFCQQVEDVWDFIRLRHQSEPLQAFVLNSIGSQLGRSHRRTRLQTSSALGQANAFNNMALGGFISCDSVSWTPYSRCVTLCV